MFDAEPTGIPGVMKLRPRRHADRRGRFVKLFSREAFTALGLEPAVDEVYFSTSTAGVVRGLHCQTPPFDYVKTVGCTDGEVFDVVLDLRRGSPTCGRHETFRLSGETCELLYLPKGIAHGFCVERGTATMMYLTSLGHHPDFDTGIRWDSAGIAWPVDAPVISDRDRSLPRLDAFHSPFVGE